MPQWKAGSLFGLFSFFCVFLLSFNISAFKLNRKEYFYPFQISENGFRANISNVSIANLPIVIHPFPYVNENANLTIWCGLQAFKSGELISFSSDISLSKTTKCNQMMIEIIPLTNLTGVWIKSIHPTQNILNIFLRNFISLLFILVLFLFYKKGKAASTQRSTIIIIFSAIFILDPLSTLLKLFLPKFSLHLSNLFLCYGLWRMANELFSEYAPLVRQSHKLFKFITAMPSIFLFILFYFKNKSFISEEILTFCGVLIGILLPCLAIWFLVMAGNTTGRFALIMQISSGVFILTSVFFINFLKMIDKSFSSSFVADMFEISFITAYTIFQLIFKAGESVEEEAMGHLPSTPVRRFDKIDEILNSLVAEDESIKFDDDDEHNIDSENQNDLNEVNDDVSQF